MTAALSWPLQRALFARLAADAGMLSLLGGAKIFDAVPHADGPGAPSAPYVTLGEEIVRPFDDKSAGGAAHDVTFVIRSDAFGFGEAKRIAAALSDALDAAPLSLSRGHVVRIRFLGAEAERDGAARRQIAVRYRIVIEDAVGVPIHGAP